MTKRKLTPEQIQRMREKHSDDESVFTIIEQAARVPDGWQKQKEGEDSK
jgi:hypothetical protein